MTPEQIEKKLERLQKQFDQELIRNHDRLAKIEEKVDRLLAAAQENQTDKPLPIE